MDLRNEDLPVTLQAFDLLDNKEIFIAEQVVNSQAEVATFTSRYVGKLIKAKKASVNDSRAYTSNTPVKKTGTSSTNIVMILVILIIVALVIYGFSTGWIQEKLNLKI
jgi:hypothetical protein